MVVVGKVRSYGRCEEVEDGGEYIYSWRMCEREEFVFRYLSCRNAWGMTSERSVCDYGACA